MTLLNITGSDYEFEGIKLHNPTIKEIAKEIDEEDNFLFAIKILTSSLKDMFNMQQNTTLTFSDFDVIFVLLHDVKISSKIVSIEKSQAIIKLLSLLFLNYKISMGRSEIIFHNGNDYIILNSNNFYILQNIIRKMFKISFLFGEEEENYNPVNKKAQEIANKFKNSKEKIAKLNNEQMNNKTGLIENYITIICVGLNLDPNNVSNLTLYQIIILFERLKMKITWDLDTSCRLAGGKPDNHPENWMSIK